MSALKQRSRASRDSYSNLGARTRTAVLAVLRRTQLAGSAQQFRALARTKSLYLLPLIVRSRMWALTKQDERSRRCNEISAIYEVSFLSRASEASAKSTTSGDGLWIHGGPARGLAVPPPHTAAVEVDAAAGTRLREHRPGRG